MLIPPPYPRPVSVLCPPGTLGIPDLPWVVGVPGLVLPKMKSLKAIFTIILNTRFAATLRHYLPHVAKSAALVPGDINLLETRILRDIRAIIATGLPYDANPLLRHVAVGIHLWGGQMGRSAFLRGDFLKNCPLSAYAELVHLIMTHPVGVPLPGGNWSRILELNNAFNEFGPSFYTKHAAFWSRAPESPIRLAILDRVVTSRFIDPRRSTAAWDDYMPYVMALNSDCATLRAHAGLAGITITDMERQLFNWANSPAAAAWVR